MPKTIDINQIGKMVLFRYPIPNSRRLPSILYKNPGFPIVIVPKITKNNNMATSVGFFEIKALYIYKLYI